MSIDEKTEKIKSGETVEDGWDDRLKDELQKRGWTIYPANPYWYACKEARVEEPCSHNEKVPVLTVKRWDLTTSQACDVFIRGCVNEVWYSLSAYSLSFDELIDKHDAVVKRLENSWSAVAATHI
jgi:hypothetical protein